MMHNQVIILSLILLLTGAVVSYPQVSGVVGHPVTLPCIYSVASGVTSMCWGRGVCPSSQCSDPIVWTDGYRVTSRQGTRYELEGKLREGNVSLTIKNAAKTDSGLYCCRVELWGWFNDMKVTLSLEIKPESPTSAPTSPRVSTSAPATPAHTQSHTPVATSSSPTQAPETPPTALQETSPQPTSSPLYSCPPDGNGTVTPSSDGFWHNNQTQVLPARNAWTTITQGISIGIALSALLLFALLVVVIIKKYFPMRKKQSLRLVSFKGPQTGALQSAAEAQPRAEDNVYIIEDNLYVMD